MNNQSIVISVHPEYVKKILSGEKKYEFRRVVPKREVKKIVIYATFPMMKVLAIADIENILNGHPDIIWNETHKDSGVSKEFFQAYFYQRKTAFAIKLTNVRKFQNEMKLHEIDSSITPPQSFRYLSDKHLIKVEKQATKEPVLIK